jgi:hypothetical protein
MVTYFGLWKIFVPFDIYHTDIISFSLEPFGKMTSYEASAAKH